MGQLRRMLFVVALAAGVGPWDDCRAAEPPIRFDEFYVGIWSVPLGEMKEVRAHFDIVANCFWASSPQGARKFLDSCSEHSLIGLPGVERNRLTDERYLESLILAIKDHPSYGGIMLIDEPLRATPREGAKSADECKHAYQVIKRLDPRHPVFIDDYHCAKNPKSGNPVETYKEAYDFFSDDNYPICADQTMDLHRRQLEYYRDSAAPKPWWKLVQMSDYGMAYYRLPTPTEERLITYVAVSVGAKSILFYQHPGPTTKQERLELWSYVKRLADELRALRVVLREPNSQRTTTIEPAVARIGTAIKEHAGRCYLIAYNHAHSGKMGSPTPQPQANVRITISGLGSATATTIGDAGLGSGQKGRTVTVKDGSFVDSFDPFAVHIYEIVPARASSPTGPAARTAH